MKRAIFYATYNGIFNNTNGVGTQTKTFLSGIDLFYERLQEEFGPFDLHLISQSYTKTWWGYKKTDLDYAQSITAKYHGTVHFCDFNVSEDNFWTPEGWKNVSRSAANLLLDQAKLYDDILLIANDVPFLHTPLMIKQSLSLEASKIHALIALYGSAYIHTKPLDKRRVEWEETGLTAVDKYPDIKIGKFSRFMYDHFIHDYNRKPADFVPYHSSLLLQHPDFQPLSSAAIEEELKKFAIPLDKPLILAFGRADWIKGFDILLNNLGSLKDQIHLVLNVVPYTDDDPIIQEYRQLIAHYKLQSTLLTKYSRTLPKALCQWPMTKIVVCPSRGEPLSNIPFEVSLWAHQQGPVLLCANLDGYREQIVAGTNGFLFEPDEEHNLENKIQAILKLDEATLKVIRNNAYEKVARERDFYANIYETMRAVNVFSYGIDELDSK